VGDTAAVFRAAYRALASFLRGTRISSLYRTAPRDYEDQPPFLNAVVSGYATLPPLELLRRIHAVETSLGRDRSREIPKGPRTLDIDILLCGRSILDIPGLAVPHPRLNERLFALVPLLELAPDLTDPRTGKTFREIADRLPDQGIYLQAEAGL
jgi:2-amino-4-hydroxy-6-hydroxymethyldihydropteridine diphosphokinase